MAKQKHYRLETLNDSIPADYHILLGERSNGKSYAVKERGFKRAWIDPNKKFMLLRRWGMEVKASYVEQYFNDAPITAITDNVCNGVICNGGRIFASSTDPKTHKQVRTKHVGYYRDLCGEQHVVSQNFDDVDYIIFEEFISRDYYLPDEVLKLMQFVSSVARRRKIDVYLIGNTISRLSPYFNEWQLLNVPKMKQGTIDLYEYKTNQIDEETGEPVIVKVSVEYCENSGNNSKMFFGKTSEMITSGTWQTQEYPHLVGRIEQYSIIHSLIYVSNGFKFKMFLLTPKHTENGLNRVFWYVRPFTDNVYNDIKFRAVRFVVDKYSTQLKILSDAVTIGFKPLSLQERVAFDMLDNIVFSDNLTGSDYYACIKTVDKI